MNEDNGDALETPCDEESPTDAELYRQSLAAHQTANVRDKAFWWGILAGLPFYFVITMIWLGLGNLLIDPKFSVSSAMGWMGVTWVILWFFTWLINAK